MIWNGNTILCGRTRKKVDFYVFLFKPKYFPALYRCVVYLRGPSIKEKCRHPPTLTTTHRRRREYIPFMLHLNY